ncbi:WD40-repeat-containing domain protein [Infundibulicybe gibba]|nr:WD40-repeat-containing domain protein [Infundibulicybe gibba]
MADNLDFHLHEEDDSDDPALFEIQDGPVSGAARTVSLSGITLQDLSRLLSASASGNTSTRNARGRPQIFTDEDEDEDEDGFEDEDEDEYFSGNRETMHAWFPEVTEPQKAGVELLNSGDFGRVRHRPVSRRQNTSIMKLMQSRSAQPRLNQYKEDYANKLIPNSNGTAVATYDANIYTGQFSKDSSFYYTCSQDFRLHIYDTTAPPATTISNGSRGASRRETNLQTKLQVKKTVYGHPGRWTITDANLSPDNERMIYSSITPTVYMTSTLDSSPVQIPIPFADPPARASNGWGFGDSFGIWSCRFSADGNEVVAGGSGKIFVYDLLANRRTVKISAHDDDVNSCCWADTASGNVLVSASDDKFLKVWDRRSLGASQKPSGVLIGHTEGITYVSAKGDGRYVISNGKDQAMRLWDLRKMRSSREYDNVKYQQVGVSNFDYRYPHYPRPKYAAHPQDCSVMTYRGHSVLRTLIRCHFSPAETTGGQYLYSGSADGKIHVWSLDGRIVQILDRAKTLPMSADPSGPEPEYTRNMRSNVCVRDVSWHSQEPVIMSAGWESGRDGSIVARHEWKGISKMRYNIRDWEEKWKQEGSDTSRNRAEEQARRQHIPGSFESEEESD